MGMNLTLLASGHPDCDCLAARTDWHLGHRAHVLLQYNWGAYLMICYFGAESEQIRS